MAGLPATRGAASAAPRAAAAPVEAQRAPLWVQNTFLTSEDARPASLEDFYTARRAHSCPPSRAPAPEDDGLSPELPPHRPSRRRPYYPGGQLVQRVRAAFNRDAQASAANAAAAAAAGAGIVGVGSARTKGMPLRQESECSTATPSSPRSEGEQVSGLPDLPSLGSAGHGEGRCKPCVFMSKRGCRSGEGCDFCHLCGPGEKKRRQRERRAFFSAMRRAGVEADDDGAVASAVAPAAAVAAGAGVLRQES
uniref:C3H1-type domain-containing protein n=1 Tax=Alexandrium catenella TaxID=2925 RepID=A0A7S1L8C3_ALECA|mmetsp:Transcript_108409/g.288536  ORF Transcript_108409/g.288536 Transcript_108409/m.288536 type:complete len:251 (+) Transcript_108409:82-834(+)